MKSWRLKIKLFFVGFTSSLLLLWGWYSWYSVTGQITDVDLSRLPSRDCAVVLTGGKGRIKVALDLIQQERVRHLIISGVNKGTALSDLLGGSSLALSVAQDRITLEKQSQTTFGNAQHSWPMLEALRCHSFYLITSQVHMARALRTFESHRTANLSMWPLEIKPPESEINFNARLLETIKFMFYSIWAF